VADGVGRLGPEVAADEVGDLLFGLADLARRVGVDPETALRARAREFRRQIEEREVEAPST
jgi:ATP diphosphatase